MNGDNGDNQRHSDLAPDQPISLRSSQPDAQPLRATPQSLQQTQPQSQPPLPPADPEQSFAPSMAAPASQSYAPGPAAILPQVQRPPTVQDEAAANDIQVSWTAAEFVAHAKSTKWYVILGAITVVAAVLAFFISDIVASIVVLFCAGLFGYMAGRQPRQLEYAIGTRGINIGRQFYPYGNFRSYSVVQEGRSSSIDFMPLKRFAPMLTIYYAPEHEDEIMDMLNIHLPIAPHARTAIDEFMHKIHF